VKKEVLTFPRIS